MSISTPVALTVDVDGHPVHMTVTRQEWEIDHTDLIWIGAQDRAFQRLIYATCQRVWERTRA